MLRTSTALASFFLLSGIALQAIGFYILLFLIILVYAYHYVLGIHPKKLSQARTQAYCAMLIWTVFPLCNILHQLLGQPIWFEGFRLKSIYLTQDWSLPLKDLIKSPLSNGLLGFSLMILIVIKLWWKRQITNQNISQKIKPEYLRLPLLDWFTQGLMWSSSALLVYSVWQHISGMDIYSANWQLGPNRILSSSGFYRTNGFYSHPLTLAGVSLSIFSFYWSILWHPQSKKKQLKPAQMISAIHFLLIILSGSRTSLIVGLFLATGIPIFRMSQKKVGPKKIFTFISGITAILSIIWASGVWTRFTEISPSHFAGSFNRLKFWEVHWAMFTDRPILGHGSAWISDRIRLAYYDLLGYGQLDEKYNAHNIYLEILASIGLVGSTFILLLVYIWWGNLKPKQPCSETQIKISAFSASMTASLLHGFTQNTFFDSCVLYVYLYLLLILFWEKFFTLSDPQFSVPQQQTHQI